MEIYLSLLALVGLSFYVHCVQFEDEANLEQTKQRGFFPSGDEPDDRYSEISGIKYVDPQKYSSDTFASNRQQLNFNGNLNRYTPQASNQFYQQNRYRPINSASIMSVVRKRPTKSSYQYSNVPSNYYNSYPADLSNPFYQNYANHYQYPSATATSYPDYYNPTRYPSSAIVNGQQALLQQPSLQYPNYYTNNYANQFGYQRPSPIYGNNGVGGSSASGISNFFNNIRESTGLGQISQVGGQFGKALEEISANDELQCVPKILCQVVKSQRRPNQMTSLLNAPGLSTIISALPSSSPLMNFGRAALLGLSGVGEYSGVCDSAYPKCPRDEEAMLYYLNNHRGGFFRFFNGGNTYGDESSYQQQQAAQQFTSLGGPAGNGDGSSQGLNLLALQALADSLNQGGNGINLNNLFSSPTNQRPAQVPPSYSGLQTDQSPGLLGGMFGSLSDVVSNLLTGVVGSRFSRRSNQRTFPDEITSEGHRIEKRIVNLKDNVAQAEENLIRESSINQQQNTLFNIEEPFKFSNENRINSAQQSGPTVSLKFPKENQNVQQEIRFSEINQGNFISPSDVVQQLKTLFPEATGHLRFDNDQFNRELLRALVNDRIGKILTGVQQQQQRPINNNYAINPSGDRFQENEGINSNLYYPAQSQNHAGVGSSNYNNYNSNYNIREQQQQQQSNDDRRHLVYITNSRGQTEYALNELTGEKTRV